MPAEKKPEKFKSRSFNKETGTYEDTETDAEPISMKCDIDQPMAAVQWARVRVGHVLKIKIAGLALEEDLQLYDPLSQNMTDVFSGELPEYPPVAGIIEQMTWNGGYDDTISLDFWVTAANWQKAANVEYREDDGAADDQDYEDVEFDFCIYEWDSVEQKFFTAFHSNGVALKGVFRFNNTDYKVKTKFTLQEDEELSRRSPRIYQVQMVITPKPALKQDVFVGVASESTITRPWGDDSLESKALANQEAEARISRKAQKKKELEDRKAAELAAIEERRLKELEKTDREEAMRQREASRLAELAQKQLLFAQRQEELAKKAAEAKAKAEAAKQASTQEEQEKAELEALEQDLAVLEHERSGLKAEYDELRYRAAKERDELLHQFDKGAEQQRRASREKFLEGHKAEEGLGKELKKAEDDWRNNDAYLKAEKNHKQAALDKKKELEKKLEEGKSAGKRRGKDKDMDALWTAIQKQEDAARQHQDGIEQFESRIEPLQAKIAELKDKLRAAEGGRIEQGVDQEREESEKELKDEREAVIANYEGRVKVLDQQEAIAATELDAQIKDAREKVTEQKQKIQGIRRTRIEATGSARSGAQDELLAEVAQQSAEAAASIGARIDAALIAAERAAIQAEAAAAGAREAAIAAEAQQEMIEALEREISLAQQVSDANSAAIADHDFRQDMSVLLKLTIEGKVTEIGGGTVTHFDIAAETWGFKGEIEFIVSLDAGEDKLNASFTGNKLCEVELAIKSKFQPTSNPPDPLKLKGIALDRRVIEDSYDALADRTVLRRRYWLSFADPASVLWKQHRPTELFNEKKLQDVINAHKGAKIAITGDWTGHWDKVKKFIFLGLGERANRASFYDFLIWYLERNRGHLVYDTATNAYKVLGTKPADGTAKKLDADDVQELKVVLPEVPRHTVNVLNGWTEATTKKAEIAFDAAVTGCRQDVLLITDIAARFDARKTLETARLVARLPELHVVFACFPSVTFAPGGLVDFTSTTWASGIYSKSKTYRIRSVRAVGRAAAPPEGTSAGSNFGEFDMSVTAVMEEKTDTAPHLPPYETPRWPVLVEGKVVSEEGEDTDETYQIYTDSDTSIDQYKVKVPLFEDKTVLVDFNPNTFHGHFYFPAFKNARVLLALEYDRAWIKRFLDWRPNARLPADSQGNHILLGKSDTSHTTINHVYVDEKPVLNVKRLSDKDTQTIVLKDGTLTIEVKEEK